MINYIKGTLLENESEYCTVLTSSGVGYQLQLPAAVQERLPCPGENVEFYVRTVVKEDSIDLYGFTNKQDRKMFVVLVSVSKLGPKTALAVLSTFDTDTLRDIVLREDYHALTRVSGIGAKTAKRIVWELKDKLSDKDKLFSNREQVNPRIESTVYQDACSALVNLGYSEAEIKPILNEVCREFPHIGVEEAIRTFLKLISRKNTSV